jgi:phage gp29-like protein
MNQSGLSHFNQARIEWAIRLKYSPMPALDMDILAAQLNAFRIGDLRQIGKTWEVMMERDGELAVNSDKRKSEASSLEWQIVSDGSPDGDRHAAALQYFYENLTATEALEQDVTGGVNELIYQVMSALDYRYSVHEMLVRVDDAAGREVTAEFRHTPIWFMECRRGYLGFMPHIFDVYGQPCRQGEWLTAVNVGWMRQLSMAYAMKMFPLRDWLLYCTRYGSGFLDGATDAPVDSPEWNQALDALKALANDGVVLHNSGVNFKFLEQSARNTLPFQPIVEMVNGLYAKCYRGVDLATSSRLSQTSPGGHVGGSGKNPVGASVQKEESGIFINRDARWVTGVMNDRVDRPMIRYLFNQEPHAWFVLMPQLTNESAEDLASLQVLAPMGFKVMLKEVYQRFHWSVPEDGEPCLQPGQMAPGLNSPGEVSQPPRDGAAAKPGVVGKNENQSGKLPASTGGSPVPPMPEARNSVAENAPIAPGADPAKWQVASTDLPDPQVDGAAGWSSVALAQPGLPIDAKADSQLPQPSPGYTLPALAVGLPNRRDVGSVLQKLTQLGLGHSRAAQAIRKQASRRDAVARREQITLANQAGPKIQLSPEVQAQLPT